MYKQSITYTDYNGIERTEDFYFNLTAAELTKRELTTPGGWAAKLQAVADSKDVPAIINAFNDIIDMAYGVKSEDGRRFIKSKEITDEFKQTPAYDELIMSFLTDVNAAVEFVNGIVPDVSKYSSASDNNGTPQNTPKLK